MATFAIYVCSTAAQGPVELKTSPAGNFQKFEIFRPSLLYLFDILCGFFVGFLLFRSRAWQPF